MENNLIMFKSLTQVMKSRDLLRKNGISTRMVRTPARLRNKSCGYSLLVTYRFSEALSIIKNNSVTVLGTASVDYK